MGLKVWTGKGGASIADPDNWEHLDTAQTMLKEACKGVINSICKSVNEVQWYDHIILNQTQYTETIGLSPQSEGCFVADTISGKCVHYRIPPVESMIDYISKYGPLWQCGIHSPPLHISDNRCSPQNPS